MKQILATILLFLLPTTVFGAIAFDSPAGGTCGGLVGSATSLTYSFTNTAGDMLIVYGMGQLTESGWTATYNGVSMTSVANYANANKSLMWQLHAPATGANNVVVSWTTAGFFYSTCASWSGTNQTDTVDSQGENHTAAGTSLWATTTVVNANSWTITGSNGDNGNNPGAGTNSTLRATIGTDKYVGIFDSNGTVGSGAHAMQTTMSVSQKIQNIIISLCPTVCTASAGTPSTYIIDSTINIF